MGMKTQSTEISKMENNKIHVVQLRVRSGAVCVTVCRNRSCTLVNDHQQGKVNDVHDL